MYMLDLAVETVEERRRDGVVVLVDLEGCSMVSVEVSWPRNRADDEVLVSGYPAACQGVVVSGDSLGSSWLNERTRNHVQVTT